MAQWLRFLILNAGGQVQSPVGELDLTRWLRLRVLMPQIKILHATAKMEDAMCYS